MWVCYMWFYVLHLWTENVTGWVLRQRKEKVKLFIHCVLNTLCFKEHIAKKNTFWSDVDRNNLFKKSSVYGETAFGKQ